MRSLNRLKVNKIYLSIFFVIIIIICLCFANSIKVNAQINESKIYTNATIDEDFDDSCVLAVLKSSFSKYNDIDSTIVNKIMQENNVLSVENISEFSEGIVNNDGTLNDRINSEIVEHLSNIEFKQVLKINLNEKSKDNVLDLIKIIEQYDEVMCAEPNYYFSPEDIPDDTMISEQWSLIGDNGIDMTKSWDFTVGTRDIRVGVLDTGIINHNDLNDNLTAGYDFYNDNSTTTDDSYGHGTSVAGIIGAVGNNTQGVTGINQRVTIVPMQVSYIEKSKTYIDTLAVKEAIQYASNLWDTENRISILNYSVSGYGSTTSLLATIETFPGLFVWSAGNKGENVDNFNNISMFNLTNLISVGAHDKYNGRSIWDSTQSSSYGSAVDIYAPGGKGLGQNSDNCYTTSASSSSSYRYFNGTSCAAPHVVGVAALLLSLNEELTAIQLRQAILESAEDITITVPDTTEGAEEDDTVEQNVLKLNSYNAVKYVLENYMNPTTYTLSNYSSTMNTNKTIASDASYFNELNGFYKLNVTYAKSYEFISSSISGIEVTLYDEDFTEIPFNDLDSTVNKVHFIESLSTGTYYLRTKYANEENTGTINTKIVSRNTTYLNTGKNDILINSYNNISSYVYGNSTGKGLYKITLSANISTGVITYPESCIKIYKDSTKQELVTRLETYTLSANTSSSSNNLIVFLDQGSTYYIDIIIPNDIYSIVSLDIEKIEDTYEINMFNNIEGVYEEEVLLEDDETQFGDYIQKIEIKQKGIYSISFIHEGPQSEASSNFLYYAFYKELIGPPEEIGNIEMLLPDMTTTMGGTITYEFTLDKGIYYIGYYNKLNYEPMSITIKYQIDVYDSNKIISDPDLLTDCGSMINIYEKNLNNKSYRGKTIVVGFTRILYLDPILEIDTRTDYSWYSSNEDIATVSEFGTIFAKSPGTVKIMAVNKDNLKIVYIETFTIINDNSTDSTERIININDTHSVSDGDYLVGLTVLNSPYPSAYLYDWEILSYDETITRIEYIGSGYFVIEGFGDVFIKGSNYAYNNKYSIKIYLNVTQ